MIIRTVLVFLIALPAFWLALRYNLHMLQLNVYRNGEQRSWLKKNLRLQWVLGATMALGLLRCFLHRLPLDILIILFLLLDIAVFNALKKMKTKKKLVFTARAKRLIVTDILVSVLAAAVVFLIFGTGPVTGVITVALGAQPVLLMAANVINIPVEKSVNRWYIGDAKKKLRGVPGLRVIGVTGSYGKTSVKFYLQELLRTRYNVLVTPESYNTPMGVVKTVRASLKPTHEIFVCEMGARYVGDIREICDIVHPDMGVITSIGPQHLDTFGSVPNIQKTKFELADALPGGGLLFLNGDSELIQEKASGYPDKIFYYVNGSGEGYHAEDVKLSPFGTEFTVTAPGGGSERFRMQLVGAHHVINVVGAIAVANTLGIPLRELIVPVRRISPVEHRMQMRPYGELTIIDDTYNSNPVGSRAAVETLAMFDGVKILVTPGMVELGAQEDEFNFNFGTYAAKCCDYIFLVGRRQTHAIREGVLSAGFAPEKCLAFDKLEEAMAAAHRVSDPGHKYILLENDLPDNY